MLATPPPGLDNPTPTWANVHQSVPIFRGNRAVCLTFVVVDRSNGSTQETNLMRERQAYPLLRREEAYVQTVVRVRGGFYITPGERQCRETPDARYSKFEEANRKSGSLSPESPRQALQWDTGCTFPSPSSR